MDVIANRLDYINTEDKEIIKTIIDDNNAKIIQLVQKFGTNQDMYLNSLMEDVKDFLTCGLEVADTMNFVQIFVSLEFIRDSCPDDLFISELIEEIKFYFHFHYKFPYGGDVIELIKKLQEELTNISSSSESDEDYESEELDEILDSLDDIKEEMEETNKILKNVQTE